MNIQAIHQYLSKKDLTQQQKAEWCHTQGFEARKTGDFNTAIEFYTISLQYYPYHFKALFNRGFANDKLNNFESAISDYSMAIKIDPKNPYAYYNRGISYDRKCDY